MKAQTEGDALIIADFTELNATNEVQVRELLRQSLKDIHKALTMDLSDATSLDSRGIGTLISLHKTTRQRGGKMRLLHPKPKIYQILTLLSLNEIFEIVNE